METKLQTGSGSGEKVRQLGVYMRFFWTKFYTENHRDKKLIQFTCFIQTTAESLRRLRSTGELLFPRSRISELVFSLGVIFYTG